MQRNELKAFRQRLVRKGYKEISIRTVYSLIGGEESYTVRARSPDGFYCVRHMSLIQIRGSDSL